MNELQVRLTMLEELLGSAAKPDVHEKFIASKAPDAASRAEEVEALGVEEVIVNSRTVFPREEGVPFLWDYQIKGFFKDACGMLWRVQDSASGKIKAYKKMIDGLIFISPRKIPLVLPEGMEVGYCQRPLRAETAQGPRVALADSETVPEGTMMNFTVSILEPKRKTGVPTLEECLIEWLDYGRFRGIGQWRNSGKGKFTYEIA